MMEYIPYIVSAAIALIGLYVIITKENLVKKILGFSIFSNGIHLFLISLGYRSSGIAPIMSFADTRLFSLVAVDPFPQAMVLTSIVINLSIVALALSIIIRVYRLFGTVDTRKLKVLKG